MGYALGGVCHASLEAAALHACGSHFPVAGDAGALTSCSAASSGGVLTLVRTMPDGTSDTWTQALTAPPCNWADWPTSPAYLSPTDGAIVAGAVASVWITAFIWRSLRSVLGDQGEPD